MKKQWAIHFLTNLITIKASAGGRQIKIVQLSTDLFQYCPSYCDASGQEQEAVRCWNPPYCCDLGQELVCCANRTLAIGDDVTESHNCSAFVKNWEIILAVCVPLACVSLVAFFAMLAAILWKKRKSRHVSERSRSSTVRSESSWNSSSLSEDTQSSAPHIAHLPQDASPIVSIPATCSPSYSATTNGENSHVTNTHDSAVTISPPPYLEKSPSYMDIVGAWQSRTELRTSGFDPHLQHPPPMYELAASGEGTMVSLDIAGFVQTEFCYNEDTSVLSELNSSQTAFDEPVLNCQNEMLES